MKATALYLFILFLIGFLFLSSKDYETAKEEAEIEQQLRQQAKLTGQDWLDYVNGED